MSNETDTAEDNVEYVDDPPIDANVVDP